MCLLGMRRQIFAFTTPHPLRVSDKIDYGFGDLRRDSHPHNELRLALGLAWYQTVALRSAQQEDMAKQRRPMRWIP